MPVNDKDISNQVLYEFIKDLKQDMNKKFEAVDKRFDVIEKRFEGVERRLDKVEDKMDYLGTRVGKLYEERRELKITWERTFMFKSLAWNFGIIIFAIVVIQNVVT